MAPSYIADQPQEPLQPTKLDKAEQEYRVAIDATAMQPTAMSEQIAKQNHIMDQHEAERMIYRDEPGLRQQQAQNAAQAAGQAAGRAGILRFTDLIGDNPGMAERIVQHASQAAAEQHRVAAVELVGELLRAAAGLKQQATKLIAEMTEVRRHQPWPTPQAEPEAGQIPGVTRSLSGALCFEWNLIERHALQGHVIAKLLSEAQRQAHEAGNAQGRRQGFGAGYARRNQELRDELQCTLTREAPKPGEPA